MSAPITKASELSGPSTPAYPVGRTLTVLLPAIVALYGVYQGTQQVLWPAQVAAVSPDHKVQILAIAGLVGGILGTIALPVGAAISDRTHSRLGKRTPWLLVTSSIVFVACALLGVSSSVPLMLVLWAIIAGFANWYQGVIYAIVPDRIPEENRGVASTVVGLGLPLGILIFVNLVARVSQFHGYLIVGGFLVLATLLFVAIAREHPSDTRPRAPEARTSVRRKGSVRPADVLAFFSGFKSWDFSMAFVSRLILFFGFFTMSGLNFYVLSDFIGPEALPGGDVAAAVATLATISTISQLVAVLIFGKLADVLDRRKAIVGMAALGLAIAFLLPLLTPTWTGMVAYSIISGACMGVYFAVDVAVMSLVLPDPENAGRDLGILAIATSVPAMLAGVIGSTLLTVTGTYASIFVFGVICSILGGLGTFLIRKVR